MSTIEQVEQERILISLATYNERDNLPSLIQEIQQYSPTADILIVDDASPDGTGRLADELVEADPRIHVWHRSGKLGLGSAIVAGMRYAMAHGFDLFVSMDADFSHHPRYLPALLAGMERHDLMVGSRYVPGGGTIDWPWQRRLMSTAINLLVRLLLRVPVHDASGGFRCYRVATLKRVDLDCLASSGYSFQEEFLHRCWRAGCRIGETPIFFEDRRAGISKLGAKEMVLSSLTLLWLGARVFAGCEVAPCSTRSRRRQGPGPA